MAPRTGEFPRWKSCSTRWMVTYVTRGCVIGESALCLCSCRCISGALRSCQMWEEVHRSRNSPPSFSENMSRWTAKLLLLVLLAGLFAPLATAASAPASHCVRKPLTTPTDAQGMPGCHHRAAGAAAPTQVKLGFVSRQCCSGHECCRSTVRSQWAQVNRPAFFSQTDLVNDHVSTLRANLRGLEPASHLFVRGPPEL